MVLFAFNKVPISCGKEQVHFNWMPNAVVPNFCSR